jgi:hypothetical protein
MYSRSVFKGKLKYGGTRQVGFPDPNFFEVQRGFLLEMTGREKIN